MGHYEEEEEEEEEESFSTCSGSNITRRSLLTIGPSPGVWVSLPVARWLEEEEKDCWDKRKPESSSQVSVQHPEEENFRLGWEGEERRRTSAHSQASLETFVLCSISFFLDTKPLYEPLDSKTQTAEKFSTPAQILLTLFILCILDY